MRGMLCSKMKVIRKKCILEGSRKVNQEVEREDFDHGRWVGNLDGGPSSGLSSSCWSLHKKSMTAEETMVAIMMAASILRKMVSCSAIFESSHCRMVGLGKFCAIYAELVAFCHVYEYGGGGSFGIKLVRSLAITVGIQKMTQSQEKKNKKK